MWINNYTGEVYDNLRQAIVTIVRDVIRCPACRTIRMINIHTYTPSMGLPTRWWEPGSEDGPGVLPEDQWISDDMEIPFK